MVVHGLFFNEVYSQPFSISFKPLVGYHQQYFTKHNYKGDQQGIKFENIGTRAGFIALLFAFDRPNSKISYETGFVFDHCSEYASVFEEINFTNSSNFSGIGLSRNSPQSVLRFAIFAKRMFKSRSYYNISKNKYLLNGKPYLIGGLSLDYIGEIGIPLDSGSRTLKHSFEFNDKRLSISSNPGIVNHYSVSLHFGAGFQFTHKTKQRFDVRMVYCLGLSNMIRNEINYTTANGNSGTFYTFSRGSNLNLSISYPFALYRHKKPKDGIQQNSTDPRFFKQ